MFLEEIDRVAKIFKSLIKEKNVKILYHLDCDGICSVSILIKILLRENVNFEARVLKQLTQEEVDSLNLKEDDILILLDLGSGQLDLLRKILEKTQVLILDHHETKGLSHFNLFHLNPLIFKEEEISSSMICYLFAKSLNPKNVDLIDLAIVGAIGDELDEKWELKGKLCKRILKEAEALEKITISKGLRLYGRNTRPIHKALEYSFDPIIPGITGSESSAVQFLSEIGIKLKNDGEWRKLKDLSIEEQQKLASAIIVERLRSKHSEAEDIFGEIYTIVGRPEELQDAREFATLLNACGRLMHHEIGIRLCLRDLGAIDTSMEILDQYKKAISESINLIKENNLIEERNFATYLLGGEKIPDTLIGTITSIFLNSNLVDVKKPIFGFAFSGEKIKVSARVSRDLKINLGDLISNAAKKLDALGGGHPFACGALIPKEKEEEFIQIIEKMLGDLLGKKD